MSTTSTLRRRLRRVSGELPEGVQALPAILEYAESNPKGPWAGFQTREEAADWYWRIHRQRISFVTYAEDGSDDLWGTPLPGEPDFDELFFV